MIDAIDAIAWFCNPSEAPYRPMRSRKASSVARSGNTTRRRSPSSAMRVSPMPASANSSIDPRGSRVNAKTRRGSIPPGASSPIEVRLAETAVASSVRAAEWSRGEARCGGRPPPGRGRRATGCEATGRARCGRLLSIVPPPTRLSRHLHRLVEPGMPSGLPSDGVSRPVNPRRALRSGQRPSRSFRGPSRTRLPCGRPRAPSPGHRTSKFAEPPEESAPGTADRGVGI